MVSGAEMLSRIMALIGVMVLSVTAVDVLATTASISEPGGKLTRSYGDRLWAFGRRWVRGTSSPCRVSARPPRCCAFLIEVAGRVEQTTQQHFSYPVLHYFHSEHRRTALSPSVARLDEALMLTLNTAPPEADLSPAVPLVLRMTRGFLEAISPTFIEPANAAPSIPRDHDADWAVTPEIGWEQFSAHRRLLKGFVETEAWTWDDVGSTDSPT
ncbi:hypothetical protein BH24ACT15_BH24ACT15_02650 [soil metagenome]